jgi:hypothetical protein
LRSLGLGLGFGEWSFVSRRFGEGLSYGRQGE